MSNEKEVQEILTNVREARRVLASQFVDREREVDEMIVAAIAQEPLLFIGAPGTGKSQLITEFKKMIGISDNEYFEYCLTKFTEPSEILGPLDLNKMKSGSFHRKTEGKLPLAKVVFLDEVFKSNSAILNTLLTILNEKKFYQDGKPQRVPMKVLFAATNEIPSMTELDALKDRFTLKVKINSVSEERWDDLLVAGLTNDVHKHQNKSVWLKDDKNAVSLEDFETLYNHLLTTFTDVVNSGNGSDPYFSQPLQLEFKKILKHIRHDLEITVSDRKFIKIYKLIRARALFMRGGGVEAEDFKIMTHLGNSEEEIETLKDELQTLVGK